MGVVEEVGLGQSDLIDDHNGTVPMLRTGKSCSLTDNPTYNSSSNVPCCCVPSTCYVPGTVLENVITPDALLLTSSCRMVLELVVEYALHSPRMFQFTFRCISPGYYCCCTDSRPH